MRYSTEELTLLKGVFGDNEKLVKLMRKMFLPEYDPNAPLGQAIDLWMTVDMKGLSAEEALFRLTIRNELISYIEFRLQEINVLANMKELSEAEKKEKGKLDSSK